MKHLAILGASGHGKVIADIAESIGWNKISFFDDAWPNLVENGPWKVIGDSVKLSLTLSSYDGIFVAIGNNAVRMEKIQYLISKKAENIVSLVHPSAVVSRSATIDCATAVMAGSVINIDAVIGCGCIINTAATVDHDCHLEEGVHISPGANVGGGVSIGRLSWVGIGASIRECVTVGTNVIAAAGAVVVDDIDNDLVVKGVPARVKKYDYT